MGKKDKAAVAAAKKQRALAKTAKKGNKKTKKLDAQVGADEQDQDIDAILAEYQSAQAKRQVITESASDPPSTRINASFTPNPLKPELFLFGGEFFDGSLASFFNELFIYSVHKNSWTKNTSPNSPLPRSSHQAVVHKDQIFLFGGEFSSPKQNTFYHYGDFWSLDCSTRAWTKIDSRPAPSARSGHRMVSVGKYILLFGGFQDTSESTKYLSDLWAFDTDEYEWQEIKPPAVSQKPEARSGCVFAPGVNNEALLYGGYCTKKVSGTRKKGVILNDYWTLKMGGDPKTWTWTKRKRPASPPSQRIGAATALHRNRLILFGGVFDTKEGEETLESTFFNDLHCFSIEAGRWFPLKVRPPRKVSKKSMPDNRRREKSARDNDLLANERILQEKLGESVAKGGADQGDGDGNGDGGGQDDDLMSDIEVDVADLKLNEIELTMTMPHPRFNANLAISGDQCFVYGGVFEQGEKEYSLNDLYAIDLAKLDGVRQVFGTAIAPIPDSDSDSDDDDEYDDDEDDEDDGGGSDGRENAGTDANGGAGSKSVFYENIPDELQKVEDPLTAAAAAADDDDDGGDVPIDPRPRPRAFENMRPYFQRTVGAWQKYLLPWNQTCSPKELRTKSFIRAEDYWWLLREEIRAEEDAVEESVGMAEVMEIAESNAEGQVAGAGGEKGVVGKRR